MTTEFSSSCGCAFCQINRLVTERINRFVKSPYPPNHHNSSWTPERRAKVMGLKIVGKKK